MFLEIFGNTLLPRRTSAYLSSISSKLCESIAGKQSLSQSDSCEDPLSGVYDYSMLKTRDFDDLQSALAFSCRSSPSDFQIQTLRDYRLRHNYGERYDSRNNVLDWDYQNNVRPRASIIHSKQYRSFRNTGVAFEYGDSVYEVPNFTLASSVKGVVNKGKDRGSRKDVVGYWGDLVVSPYVAFGVRASNARSKSVDRLFYILNKGTGTAQHRHDAASVSTHNVMSALWTIETGEAYRMTRKDDIFSGLGGDASDVIVYANGEAPQEPQQGANEIESEKERTANPAEADARDAGERGTQDVETNKEFVKPSKLPPPPPQSSESARSLQAARRARAIMKSLSLVKITPLSPGSTLASLSRSPSLKNFFDVVYFSSHSLHDLPSAGGVMKGNGRVIVESARHLFSCGQGQVKEVDGKVMEVGNGAVGNGRGLSEEGWVQCDGDGFNHFVFG